MLVYTYFEGDDNEPLKDLQHEMYDYSISTIIEEVKAYYLNNKCASRYFSNDEGEIFSKKESFDHRLIQDTHDMIAAVFRYQVKTGVFDYELPEKNGKDIKSLFRGIYIDTDFLDRIPVDYWTLTYKWYKYLDNTVRENESVLENLLYALVYSITPKRKQAFAFASVAKSIIRYKNNRVPWKMKESEKEIVDKKMVFFPKVDFSYRLMNAFGWAEIQFTNGEFSRTYAVEEWVGDDLKELLGGLIAVSGYETGKKVIAEMENRMENADGVFEWIASVGCASVKFIFKPLNKKTTINLKIIEYDYNDKDEECVYDQEINLNELIDSLLISCNELLQKYGILGYFENFWLDFPVSYYLILKDYRERKLKYGTVTEKIDDKDEELHKTDIKIETSYLGGLE